MDDPWVSYFNELCSILDRAPYGRNVSLYSKLLWQLHNTPFRTIVRMDENRTADAVEFRRTYFGRTIDHEVCMLEVMLTLARRIEIDVMQGTTPCDRTVDWFWVMVDSLGLSNMTDEVYNEAIVKTVLKRFEHGRYSPDGRGGLFTVSNSGIDMRKQEIWYQAALYLTDILRIEGYIEP